jgi:uncharacterized protein (UPF0276 family)
MAVASASAQERRRPMLAVSYNGGEPGLLERLIPLVDAVEFAPDAIARSEEGRTSLRPEVLAELRSAQPDVKLLAHGVGLSIGSFDSWHEGYLRLVDELLEHLELAWHSEHLAYTTVAGESLGTMLPLPRTTEAVELVCKRVGAIQERYGLQFLLENVIGLLPDAPSEFSPAGFLNEITSRTGCGVLLDAYNLECDRHNQALDVDGFLDELDLSTVIEIHLAGGVEQQGFQLDIHSQTTAEGTLTLARTIGERAPNLRAVTFEYLNDALPLLGHDAICDELGRIREAL